MFGDNKTEDVVVPNLIGRDYTEVINDREITSNFTIDRRLVENDTVPKNQIYDQDPKPRNR